MKAEREMKPGRLRRCLNVPVPVSNRREKRGWWKQGSHLVVGLLNSSPGTF